MQITHSALHCCCSVQCKAIQSGSPTHFQAVDEIGLAQIGRDQGEWDSSQICTLIAQPPTPQVPQKIREIYLYNSSILCQFTATNYNGDFFETQQLYNASNVLLPRVFGTQQIPPISLNPDDQVTGGICAYIHYTLVFPTGPRTRLTTKDGSYYKVFKALKYKHDLHY